MGHVITLDLDAEVRARGSAAEESNEDVHIHQDGARVFATTTSHRRAPL